MQSDRRRGALDPSASVADHVERGPQERPQSIDEQASPLPLRHPGRLLAAILVLAVAGLAIKSMLTNDAFQWNIVALYFTERSILTGVVMTLALTLGSMTAAVIIGVIVAVMRLSDNHVLRSAAFFYVWLFRGVPQLVQIILWFDISFLFPKIEIAIPYVVTLGPVSTNSVITPLVSAFAALSLCEAAYMAEIIRGGILSIGVGQREASAALGLSAWFTFRRIVLPQAMRTIVPPTGNELIGQLKNSSLVSVVAIPELLGSVETIYQRNFLTIPLLMVATIWYLVMTSVFAVFQFFIERYYGRSGKQTESRVRRRRLHRSRPESSFELAQEEADPRA